MLSLALAKRLYPTKIVISEFQSIRTILQSCTKHETATYHTFTKFNETKRTISRNILNKFKFFQQNVLVRYNQTKPFEVNTNVLNNVLLYKHERPTYYRNMLFFGVMQLFAWVSIAYASYTPQILEMFRSFDSFTRDISLKLPVFFLSVIIGPTLFIFITTMQTRAIKYLVLNKGGKKVTIFTYHFLPSRSRITVPIDDVTCKYARGDTRSSLPVKVKSKLLYYLLDSRGQYCNGELFDFTVGQRRLLK